MDSDQTLDVFHREGTEFLLLRKIDELVLSIQDGGKIITVQDDTKLHIFIQKYYTVHK